MAMVAGGGGSVLPVALPVTLSPWPQTAPELKAATAFLRAALGEDANETADPTFAYDDIDRRIQALGAAVSARVEEYAPCAPADARSEALIRGTAWLWQTEGAERVTAIGPLSSEAAPVNSAAWFLHSGASSLLTRWKQRRAGAI